MNNELAIVPAGNDDRHCRRCQSVAGPGRWRLGCGWRKQLSVPTVARLLNLNGLGDVWQTRRSVNFAFNPCSLGPRTSMFVVCLSLPRGTGQAVQS